MTERMRGATEMTIAMVMSGTIGWFVVKSGRPVIDVVFWRCIFGAATLLLICAAMGLLKREVMSARQAALAAFGGVAVVINWLLLFAAYPRASISIATTVYNTQPFMLVGLGAIFLRERLTAATFVWLGVAFAGTLIIAQQQSDAGIGSMNYLIGVFMALGAAFFYAVAAIIAKTLKGVPPYLIVLVQVSIGGITLAPFANLSRLPADSTTWGTLGTLGVVHTGLVFILLYGAIQKLPTNVTGSLSFIYPLVAILVDFIAFGHRLTLLQIIGAAMILLSAAGMTLGWTPFKKGFRNLASDSCTK